MQGIDKKTSGTDIIYLAESFLCRLREKLLSAKHSPKKTDRFKMMTRYPEYCEETEEEKKKASHHRFDPETIYKQEYDNELLAKFKSFFAFLARIFKKRDSETQ